MASAPAPAVAVVEVAVIVAEVESRGGGEVLGGAEVGVRVGMGEEACA